MGDVRGPGLHIGIEMVKDPLLITVPEIGKPLPRAGEWIDYGSGRVVAGPGLHRDRHIAGGRRRTADVRPDAPPEPDRSPAGGLGQGRAPGEPGAALISNRGFSF